MLLNSLGYVGIHSQRLDDWATFGPAFLGLELVERTKSQLKFRMDDRSQRIVVSNEETVATAFGFELSDAAALDALGGRLEAAGVVIERLPRAECERRAVADAIRFKDPAGNRLEGFHGAETIDAPFKPGRPLSGFRTGTLGMGHAVLHVESADDLLWFYRDVLGFALSDYLVQPIKAFFFHLNPRHHSLALIETGKTGVHHFMMELQGLDDVGQAYDIASSEKDRVAISLGRHTNDLMTSFYTRTPENFLIEYGWGGRTIEPEGWQPSEMKFGGSLWGHERPWLPEDQLRAARQVRARAAAAGQRAPVQVMDGNYRVGTGECAWWDGVKQS